MNSIPKAGTNLLETCLNRFPLLRNAGYSTLRGWQFIDDVTLKKIRNIKRGQFFSAHLPAHAPLLSLMKNEDIKVLLMIRDPRDIVVSHFKYVTSIDTTHRTHKYFASLPDDDSRLMATICGVEGLVSPIDEVLSKFEEWLDRENVLVVRFEDLIGSQGGGNNSKQLQVVNSIARHLGIKLDDKHTQEISENVYSTKTMTFRSGKIGNWRKFFKDKHINVFKERAGELLVKYGYEKNKEWQ